MPAVDLLILFKGLADIIAACILVVQPDIIYKSSATRALHDATGLHISRVETAPGFNQAIACMVVAVGVGHIVASQSHSPLARRPVFAMNLTWAALNIATCLTPRAWELASATQLMTAMTHTVFSTALYLTGAASSEVRNRKKKDK
ncbi:hypothetical protein BDN72DRAFT_847596 [Pluteus cervinus]|uniref:Uncharacterized protein n=1 Tax=Pluteus cervinus TaxID=181527 RepID=A0ACD3AC59_9AGAR|nr:hypothetical protein BDN72DRAFT_847596 [Pluteus cervinus]